MEIYFFSSVKISFEVVVLLIVQVPVLLLEVVVTFLAVDIKLRTDCTVKQERPRRQEKAFGSKRIVSPISH